MATFESLALRERNAERRLFRKLPCAAADLTPEERKRLRPLSKAGHILYNEETGIWRINMSAPIE